MTMIRQPPYLLSFSLWLLLLVLSLPVAKSFCPPSCRRGESPFCFLTSVSSSSTAFSRTHRRYSSRPLVGGVRSPRRSKDSSSTTTALNVLLDVPDGFFTVTFPMLGILLSFSKSFARIRMEERAWEQRLAEGRQKLLAQDPTLTELDIRRMEASQEWSAYGKPRWEEEQQQSSSRRQQQQQQKSRVGVAERENDTNKSGRDGLMSDEDIAKFESLYGVEYDPYYDDPYTEDELPQGKFTVDKRYGDRVYADGEIFYKTAEGLYYRQGAKPRNWKLW